MVVYLKLPYAIESVPSLSGHVIAYRWRLLPRVRRYRASKSQDNYVRVLPWQVTMDQSICAFFSHTHYWYEVGMLKDTGKLSNNYVVCMVITHSRVWINQVRLPVLHVVS